MRATSKLLALALTATMQSAMAGAVFLDFEDVQSVALINSRYAAQGVVMSGAAWAATSEACNKYGPNQNQPGFVPFIRSGSCGALYVTDDPFNPSTGGIKSLTINLASGFDGFSFVYSGSISSIALQLHAYDATGREVGGGISGLLGSGCTDWDFCNWSSPLTWDFKGGVATTLVISGLNQAVLLDDLRFSTPVAASAPLPEPTSIALAVGALGALGWTRRRSAR